MRVVFLTHNYPRHAGDLAGAFLHPLAVALRDRGHDLQVVAPSDQGRGGTETLDGIPVTRVRYASPDRERYAYTGRMTEALRSPLGWLAIARLLRALRDGARNTLAGAADGVVHAHWWFPAGFAAPAGPTVVTLHGTDARLLAAPGATALARRALRSPRVVTAVSRSVATAAAAATGRSVETIPIQPMPLPLGDHPATGGGGLIVVGRLTAQKRVDLAAEAHHSLLTRFPDLPLTIVGDGPERPRLEALVGQLGTGGLVRFIGQVAPDRVGGLIADCDLMIFPAQSEGLGLAVVEGLAVGVPAVVCQDGGGVLDLVTEPGAGTVTGPTPEAIAGAAATLLDRPGRREAALRIGRGWRQRLAPAAVAEFFEARYREALGE